MIWRRLFFVVAAISMTATAYATPGVPCEELRSLKLTGVTHLDATPVAAAELPAYCRVKIVIASRIKVEVWLPSEHWNGRFHGRGIGGTAGLIVHQYLADSLREGYATATTDTGHDAADLNWASNADGSTNLQALEDYGWRAVHEMTLKAKAVIAAYYGRPSRYNYFSGCSGGGRQGLTEIQRFPEDYDGVLVGCVPNAFNRELATFLWSQVVMRQRLGQPIALAKLHALTDAVVKSCDGNDGVVDGIVNDPRKCEYDPAQLLCERSAASPTCLTANEADAVRAIWAGPRSRKTGERIWFTSEKTVYSATWDKPYPIGVELLKWVTEDAQVSWTMLTEDNFESFVDAAIKKLGHAFDADDPRISKFIRRGGKVLLWHGDADWGDPSRNSINYVYRVLETGENGQHAVDSIRLFLLPGVEHCDIEWGSWKASAAPFPSDQPVMQGAPYPGAPFPGFPFPDRLFDALVSWVEVGVPPERVTASQQLASGQIRTRPLCAFPKTAKWNGVGDTNDADSFACVDGGQNRSDFTTKYDR